MWFWFGLAVVLLLTEVLTVDLICVWFGAAALLVGVVTAIFPSLPIPWQFAIFVATAIALVAATRPLVKRLLRTKRNRDTNLDRLMGQVAVVTERIDNLAATGAVRLGGVVWTARSLGGETVEVGEYVVFEKIEGNKALVKRKGE
jgi:membrane protein implicated in regulation of membrane protease activity